MEFDVKLTYADVVKAKNEVDEYTPETRIRNYYVVLPKEFREEVKEE